MPGRPLAYARLSATLSDWATAMFNAMEAFKDDCCCITMDQRNAKGGESTGPIPSATPGARSRAISGS
jgi:hypothetical protein